MDTPVSTTAPALSYAAGLLALVLFTVTLWGLRQAGARQTDISSKLLASGQPASFVYPQQEKKSISASRP